MRSYRYIFLLVMSVATFSYCNTAKKATSAKTVFYDTDVKNLVETKCTPCHVPSKGGKKAALDTYDDASKYIDDIIRRIELNPGEKGFMPFKHPNLSAEEISIFKTWKAEGLTRSK